MLEEGRRGSTETQSEDRLPVNVGQNFLQKRFSKDVDSRLVRETREFEQSMRTVRARVRTRTRCSKLG